MIMLRRTTTSPKKCMGTLQELIFPLYNTSEVKQLILCEHREDHCLSHVGRRDISLNVVGVEEGSGYAIAFNFSSRVKATSGIISLAYK